MLNKIIKSNKDSNKFYNEKWIIGFKKTKIGDIPIVSTKLSKEDIISGFKARWDINRMNYKIQEGLYAIGDPDEKSEVLVTANYKLTFDKLRKELSNLNEWILVLDTKGINVWCAAGEGTFGTQELLKRIASTKLKEIINHNRIILPQLGATGVSAHIIKKASGLKVIYGPVYAKDIKEFLNNNYNKTDEMKRVHFNLIDRLVVIPVELVQTIKPALIIFGIILILNVIRFNKFSFTFLMDYIPFLGAILIGVVIIPIFLPIIPFRSFSLKGFLLSLIWAIVIGLLLKYSYIGLIINILLITPITSFLSLNFTGATTFTSISGVKKEVKIATPLFIISISAGLILNFLHIFKII